MDNIIADVLTNSIGAVAVTIVFLFYLDRQDKRTTNLIQNHLKHSTDAMQEMSIALTKLVTVIGSLKRFIKKSK